MSQVDKLIFNVKCKLFGDSIIDDIAGKLGQLDIDDTDSVDDISDQFSSCVRIDDSVQLSNDQISQFIQSPILNNYLRQFISEQKYLLLENENPDCNIYNDNNIKPEEDPNVKTLLSRGGALKRIFKDKESRENINGSTETIEIAKSIKNKQEYKHSEKAQWGGIINYICNYTIPTFLTTYYYTHKLDDPVQDFMDTTDVGRIHNEYITNKDLYYLCNNAEIVDSVIDKIPEIRAAHGISPDAPREDVQEHSNIINTLILSAIWNEYKTVNKDQIIERLNEYKNRLIRYSFFLLLFNDGDAAWAKYQVSDMAIKKHINTCITKFNESETSSADNPFGIMGDCQLNVTPANIEMYKDRIQRIKNKHSDIINKLGFGSFTAPDDADTVMTESIGMDFDSFLTSIGGNTSNFYNMDDLTPEQEALQTLAEEQSTPDEDDVEQPTPKRARKRNKKNRSSTSSANVPGTCTNSILQVQSIFNDIDKCILVTFKTKGQWVDQQGSQVDSAAWNMCMELVKTQTKHHNLLKCMYYILYRWASGKTI